MDETTSLLLQRVAVLHSHLNNGRALINPETLDSLVTDLERAIERLEAGSAVLAREKGDLERRGQELAQRNELLIHQKDSLDRQKQSLERQCKTLERHNTNLMRQNSQLQRVNAALEEQRAALEGERKRYIDLFEYTPDASLITDASGAILEANRAGFAMLNSTSRELRGENLLRFIAPTHQQLFVTLLTHLKRIQDIELSLLPLGRPPLEISLTLSPLSTETGKPALLHWTLRDITERRRAMAALNASERRFRTIFNEANIGILLLDKQGKIARANRTLQEMLGYGEEELYNRPIQELSCPEDPPLGNVGLILDENHTGQFVIETRFRRRDGQYIWTSVSLSGIRGEQSELLYLIGMVKDISAEKQAAADVAEMRRRLLESGEVERLRLAQELHDGPTQDVYSAVFTVSVVSEDLEDQGLQQHFQEHLEMLRGVANTLRDIVGELRPPTIANLGLERAIRAHAEKVLEEHPELELKLHLTRDGQALSPQTRLAFFRIYQQCMSNILRHAQASQVVVAFHVNESTISLDMWDNGKGFTMPRKWVDLMREGHFGLAQVAERVYALGGELKVETRPGAGTLVHVTAPVQKE